MRHALARVAPQCDTQGEHGHRQHTAGRHHLGDGLRLPRQHPAAGAGDACRAQHELHQPHRFVMQAQQMIHRQQNHGQEPRCSSRVSRRHGPARFRRLRGSRAKCPCRGDDDADGHRGESPDHRLGGGEDPLRQPYEAGGPGPADVVEDVHQRSRPQHCRHRHRQQAQKDGFRGVEVEAAGAAGAGPKTDRYQGQRAGQKRERTPVCKHPHGRVRQSREAAREEAVGQEAEHQVEERHRPAPRPSAKRERCRRDNRPERERAAGAGGKSRAAIGSGTQPLVALVRDGLMDDRIHGRLIEHQSCNGQQPGAGEAWRSGRFRRHGLIHASSLANVVQARSSRSPSPVAR
jgi:hypothetical protein